MPIKITKEDLIKQMKPGVFILRGLPGSGKSTFADKLTATLRYGHDLFNVYSADKYWINDWGEYNFDITQVPKNHQECLLEFMTDLYPIFYRSRLHFLIDNTNTSIPEMETYIKIAQAYGLDVSIVTFNCSIERSVSRNVHKVPEATIKRMFEKLCYANERLDKYCEKSNITNYEIIDHA